MPPYAKSICAILATCRKKCYNIPIMSTCYSILGLPETATDEEIKQAYRTLAKQYHPDLHPGNAETAKKFAEVNEAMEAIGTPEKRREYDRKRRQEKQQQEIAAARAAAAQAAAARAAAARAASARPVPGMGAAASRAYAGSAQGAAAVVNEAYRKGYNEGFAAGQAAAQQERNATAETWKKSADSWKKEAEKCRQDIDTLKAALEKTRQRAADADAAARRMDAALRLQKSVTEDARRNTEAEASAKESLRESLESKLNAEREARRYSDADKVRLSREVARLKEENERLKERLLHPEEFDGAASFDEAPAEPQKSYTEELYARVEAGDGAAAVTLGQMYLDGDEEELPRNVDEAVRLFTLGTELGNADAVYHMGLCYINGDGVEADLMHGVQLIREAASKGSEAAATFIRDAEQR